MGVAGVQQAVSLWGQLPARGMWAFAPPDAPRAHTEERRAAVPGTFSPHPEREDSPRLNAVRLVLAPALHLMTMYL